MFNVKAIFSFFALSLFVSAIAFADSLCSNLLDSKSLVLSHRSQGQLTSEFKTFAKLRNGTSLKLNLTGLEAGKNTEDRDSVYDVIVNKYDSEAIVLLKVESTPEEKILSIL